MDEETFAGPTTEPADRTTPLFDPSLRLGRLNEALREKLLAPRHNNAPDKNEPSQEPAPVDAAVSAVEQMLALGPIDREVLDHKLGALYRAQTEIYFGAGIPATLRKRQFIARGGVVLSPDNCISSVLDALRVRAFTRGVDAALEQLQTRRQADDGPIHIVYPACGPFAPLLLPLLAYYRQRGIYSPSQLQITLIDIHQGAVMSLQALVRALDVEDYIHRIECTDALDYKSNGPVHLVVLEAMQHGFSREAHLTLARHFARTLEPGGVFVPQEVSVRAVLNIGQREYVDQWQASEACESARMDPAVQAERTDLGEILRVTPHTLRNLNIQTLDEYTSLIECATVHIPESLPHPDKQLLMLCSDVHTFNGEQVREYDSGITHPLPDEQVCIDFQPQQPRPGDLPVHRGDALTFYYRLNGLPGFFAVKQ